MQALQRACDFLLHVQREDGGWAESYLSCVVRIKETFCPVTQLSVMGFIRRLWMISISHR